MGVGAGPDVEAFAAWLKRTKGSDMESLLVCRRDDGAIAGVYNISQIFYGHFRSAYLGYYAFAPFAGRGYMREGLSSCSAHAFGPLGLHRLEANIQPENAPSIALVAGAGFRLEGFSPRYLKIAGRWRDHERWAILAEEFRRSEGAGPRTKNPPGYRLPTAARATPGDLLSPWGGDEADGSGR